MLCLNGILQWRARLLHSLFLYVSLVLFFWVLYLEFAKCPFGLMTEWENQNSSLAGSICFNQKL